MKLNISNLPFIDTINKQQIMNIIICSWEHQSQTSMEVGSQVKMVYSGESELASLKENWIL